MTAHKHAEMIKAKADNMDLVVLLNKYGKWQACHETSFPIYSDCEYFLCLPQHNENGQCLHWLNGGSCLISFESVKDTFGVIHGKSPKEWTFDCGFMNTDAAIRIKPKKEKRWIVVHKNGYTTSPAYKTKDECIMCHFDGHRSNMVDWQFIGIEVEA